LQTLDAHFAVRRKGVRIDNRRKGNVKKKWKRKGEEEEEK
jgi:hypothetical protein